MSELKNKFINFDIESAEIVDENPDSRFMTARIQAFSSGRNRHDMECSVEVLKSTAPSIYNAPVIYNIVKSFNDFGSHTSPDKSLIAGFIVPGSAQFAVLEDGRTALVVLAKISKRYAPKVVEILKREFGKSKVSVEMELNNAEERDDGLIDMLDFTYFAVCLLGAGITEASPGANIEVLSFAEENKKYQEEYLLEFSNKYADIDFTIPKKIKDNAKKSLDIYKDQGINASSVSLAMARFLIKNELITPEKVRLMSKFFNRKDQYDEVTLGFYGGKDAAKWSKELFDSIESINNKQLSYFVEDKVITFPYDSLKDANPAIRGIDPPVTLAQANAIARQADAIGGEYGWPTAIKSFKESHKVVDGAWVKKSKTVKEEYSVKVKKTEGIKKAEIKFSLNSSQITEILNSAVSGIKYGTNSYEKYWVYAFDEEFVYLRDSEEGKNYRAKYQISDLKASVDFESKEEVISGAPIPVEEKAYTPEFADEDEEPDKDDPKEGEEDKDKEPPEDKPDGKEGDEGKDEDKKNMSLDSNLDVAAFLAMLADETEDYQALVAKHQAGEDLDPVKVYAIAYAKMCKMAEELKKAKEDRDTYMSENEGLKQFKADIESKQFAYEVESTIAEVAETMPKAEIEKARENSKNFNLETVDAWKNEVKALAFSLSKDKKVSDGINRIAISWVDKDRNKQDLSKGWVK